MNFVDERLLPRYFDRAGKPIDSKAWTRLRCNTSYCRVRSDERVIDAAGVICAAVTMWTGVNLRPFAADTDELFIFETIVFGGVYDLAAHCYATEAAARAGHAAVVADLRAGRAPWWVNQMKGED